MQCGHFQINLLFYSSHLWQTCNKPLIHLDFMITVHCLSSLEFWKMWKIGMSWSFSPQTCHVLSVFCLCRVSFNKRSVSGCNLSAASDVLSGDDMDTSLNAQNVRIAERRSNSNTDIQSRFTPKYFSVPFLYIVQNVAEQGNTQKEKVKVTEAFRCVISPHLVVLLMHAT